MFYVITNEKINTKIKTPKDILGLLNSVEYGWYDYKNNKKITEKMEEFNTEYINNNCRILKPNELLKYKIGTCWDQSLFIYFELQKLNIPCYSFVIYSSDINHTYITYKQNEKYYWLENAWKDHKGLHGPFKDNNDINNQIKKYFKKQTTDTKIKFHKVDYDKILNETRILTPEIFISLL